MALRNRQLRTYLTPPLCNIVANMLIAAANNRRSPRRRSQQATGALASLTWHDW